MEFVSGAQPSLGGDSDFVVIRSLTKLWSLAGIRAGYLLGPAELVERLAAQRQPWSVSAPACAAIVACSRDRETPIRVAAEVAAERAWLATALGGVEAVQEVWPSAANFLLLRMADGLATVSGLADQGISVRPAGSFPGLGVDHVRVAVRRRPDNERLVEGLSNL
jgi:histidinol-phosphate/aromatic aminotransferase/cobyric acid decarboxylase-like protein